MMTTYGEQPDHTPLPGDVFTWAGSYNERSLVLAIDRNNGRTPFSVKMTSVTTTSMGDTYHEDIIASGPGWVATICAVNFDPSKPGAEQVAGDNIYEVVNLGYLGQRIVYPIKRPLRPGEVTNLTGSPKDNEPTEAEYDEIRTIAARFIDFVSTHQDGAPC